MEYGEKRSAADLFLFSSSYIVGRDVVDNNLRKTESVKYGVASGVSEILNDPRQGK